MDFYTTSDVCELLKVSHQTVKTWANEFSRYLSPTASPEKGRKRLFTTDDLAVFSLVHEMHLKGNVYEDAHIALSQGDRGVVPTSETALISTPPPALLSDLRNRIRALESELVLSRSEADEAKGQVKLMRDLFNEQLAIKEAQIKALYIELGRLAGKLGDDD